MAENATTRDRRREARNIARRTLALAAHITIDALAVVGLATIITNATATPATPAYVASLLLLTALAVLGSATPHGQDERQKR